MPQRMAAPASTRRTYRRTKAEQTELESLVVKVCLQLFDQGGYEAISMRKLAGEVGVAPMSLYRYFPTKTHLMRHIWNDVLQRACNQGLVEASRARRAHTRLRGFLNGYLQYWLENRSHYWVVFAVRDDLSALQADTLAEALRPDPAPARAAIAELIESSALPLALPSRERHELAEMVFQRLLGFLLGVVGLASVPWAEVAGLKERVLDDIEQQVRARVEARGQAAPAGQIARRA